MRSCNMLPDGTLENTETRQTCNPPGTLLWRSDTGMTLNCGGRKIDDQFIDSLIDTFTFFSHMDMDLFIE